MSKFISTWVLAATLAASGAAMAQAVIGAPAPAFSAVNTSGKTVSLTDYYGKYVVLEWTNPGCPFVQKHYDSGNIPATQKDAMAKGAVWLSIATTATDSRDYKSPVELTAWQTSKNAKPTATLMDPDGKVGRAYSARTTPHMYIIDPTGKLVYAGAIDSKPTANVDDIKTATNYVSLALAESMAGKPVSKPTTQAYGCSVKYPSAG